MRYAKYITLLILIATAPVLKAQGPVGKHVVSVGWGINIPVGDSQFLNKTNYVAPTLGYEYLFSDSFSLGLTVGYAYSREKGDTRDNYDGALGDQYTDRKLTLIPIQIQLRYYMFNDGENRFVPFVTVEGGVQYADYYIVGDKNISTTKKKNWSYVVAPGLGLRIIPDLSRRFNLDLKANWKYGGNEFPILDIKSQQYIGIQLAFGYKF